MWPEEGATFHVQLWGIRVSLSANARPAMQQQKQDHFPPRLPLPFTAHPTAAGPTLAGSPAPGHP
jgi:hypothetical protein